MSLIRNIKEFINVTGLLLSRKTGFGKPKFIKSMSFSEFEALIRFRAGV